jgi:ribonuclease D
MDSDALNQPQIQSNWIADNASLAAACVELNKAPVLAIDCEFVRERTFYPIAALIQVFDGESFYLIDPTSCDDFSALKEVLQNPAITTVLHSCSEDLEVFLALLGVVPAFVFDTQLASAFLGGGLSLGYHRLVMAEFEVELPKTETRSDWMRRPLSEAQVTYAIDDVRYLIQLYEKQRHALQQNGKWEWFRADCLSMLQAADKGNDFSSYYLKFKGASKFNRRQLALLQLLCEWREAECRRRDMPRNWLLHDNVLRSIVLEQPDSMIALGEIKELGKGAVNRYGNILLGFVVQAKGMGEDDLPVPMPQSLSSEARAIVKKLKALVREKAETLEVAPEILARKKDYEALVQSGINTGQYQLPATLTGWRREVIGDAMLAILKGGVA